MRKRKSPIALITALIVVAAGIFGFNFATSRPGGNPADQPPAPEVTDAKQVGDARPATPGSQIASSVNSAIAGGGPKATEDGPGKMGMGGPMILNPGAGAPQKPKPNPSSTSAQWYDKDSALANKH